MNSFLSLFDFSPKPDRRREPGGSNRRQSIRYGSGSEVTLGWWDEDEFRSAEGTLLDVSQGGAAVVLPGAVHLPEGVAHLRLSEGDGSAWIDAEIRSAHRLRSGTQVVHLQFTGGCSYSFFRAALPGTFLDPELQGCICPEFETRHWR